MTGGGQPGDPNRRDRRDPSRRVRPYTMTRGRTGPADADLPIETLVVTAAPGGTGHAPGGMPPRHEERAIMAACLDVLSVAELSARLDLPVNVVRILVCDLAEAGMVRLHRPAASQATPDLELLARVLGGLKAMR
jgi:Protein of unknown function (DUF742)